jgi:tail lysozyme
LGFGRELRDFSEGLKSGMDLAAKQEELRRKRPASASDIAGEPQPFGAGGTKLTHTSGDGGGDKTGAIPAPGGGGGKIDNDTSQIAGRLKGDLMRDFKLSPVAANGIVASLAAESGGFKQLQELAPTIPGTQGGWGYAQWTGPRRVAFANYAQQNKLDPKSYEANYGFLKQELSGPEGSILKQLANAKTTDQAIDIFTGSAAEKRGYLRPGKVNLPGRLDWGRRLEQVQPVGADGKPVATAGTTIDPNTEWITKPTDKPQTEEDIQRQGAEAEKYFKEHPNLEWTTPTDKRASATTAIPEQAGVQVAEQNPWQPAWQVAQVNDQQVQAGGQAPPREDQAMPATYANRGGAIPEPAQRFQAGGTPIGNPAPSKDPYSSTRAYTQPVAATPSTGFVARRVGQANPNSLVGSSGPLMNAAGRTPSQEAFYQMQQRAAAPAPAAAPAAAPVNPLAGRPPPQRPMPSAWQGGAGFYYGADTANQDRINAENYQRQMAAWQQANPGVRFARGGQVGGRELFNKFLDEERQRGGGTAAGGLPGESPRDRAALRYNLATTGRHSYAYKDDEGFFQKPKPAAPSGGKGGGKGKTPAGVKLPETTSAIPTSRPTGPDMTKRPVPEQNLRGPEQPPVPQRPVPEQNLRGPAPYAPETQRPPYEANFRDPWNLSGRGPQMASQRVSAGFIPQGQSVGQQIRTAPGEQVLQPIPPPSQAPIVPADVMNTPYYDPNYGVPPAYQEGGAIPDGGWQPFYESGGKIEGYENQPDSATSPASASALSSPDDTQPPEPAAEADTRRPERRQYDNVAATPKLLQAVGDAISGGVNFLTSTFGLDTGRSGAVPTPEAAQGRDAGVQRFASGEGAATRQEIEDIDNQVDPNRNLDEGHRQMVRLAKTMQYYRDQNRPDDAKAAAASLLQYGAQRFGQLGSLAGAAYSQYQQSHDPKDLEHTVRFLEQAYDMIPDGAQMRVEINDQTGKLEAYHKDAEGHEQKFEISPQELPQYIRQTMDNSMYWNSILTTADPTMAHQKQEQQYQTGKAEEERGYTRSEEERKHERDTEEELAKEQRAIKEKAAEQETANKEWERRHKVERGETEQDKLQTEAFKRADEQWKLDHPTQTKPKIDMSVAGPALTAATQARADLAANKDDPQAQDNYNEAVSRLLDATGGDAQYLSNFGFDLLQGSNFVYKGAKELLKPPPGSGIEGPDPQGRYWKKLPNGQRQEVRPKQAPVS